jgi:hypothetical protein
MGLDCDAGAAIDIRIRPSPAPNAFGSPSWPQYLEWARFSLRYGLGDIGLRAVNPSAYHVITDPKKSRSIHILPVSAIASA